MAGNNDKKSTDSRPGRRTSEEAYEDSRFVIDALLRQHIFGPMHDDRIALEYQDIEAQRGIQRRAAKQTCRDTLDFCSLIRGYERGIQVDTSTYFQQNRYRNRSVKQQLAQRFSEVFGKRSANAVAFGPGTTVLACAQVLAEDENHRPKVAVTNSLAVCEALSSYETCELIVTGGQYRHSIHAFVGERAVRGFRDARCEVAVIGVSALSIEGELLVRYPDEPEVLSQMLRSTTERVFVVTAVDRLTSRDTFPVMRIEDLLKGDVEVIVITNPYATLKDKEQQARAKAVVDRLGIMGERVRIIGACDAPDSSK